MHTTSTPAHLAESEFNWILTGIRSEISLVFQDSIGQKPKKKKKSVLDRNKGANRPTKTVILDALHISDKCFLKS